MKTITEIRKSISEKYLEYTKTTNELFNHINEMNKLLPKALTEADELLGIVEASIKLREVDKKE